MSFIAFDPKFVTAIMPKPIINRTRTPITLYMKVIAIKELLPTTAKSKTAKANNHSRLSRVFDLDSLFIYQLSTK